LPRPPVTREAYERIAGAIIDGIRAARPLDAVYLDLHGAFKRSSWRAIVAHWQYGSIYGIKR